MYKNVCVVGLLLALGAIVAICTGEDDAEKHVPLEPKDNTWELNVILEDIGVLDIRGLGDLHVPKATDHLAITLGRDDLPARKLTDAEKNAKIKLPKTTARKYLYVVFTLENLTEKPVMDPATNFPKTDADGKVIYKYVPISTRKVIPDTTALNIPKISETLLTTISVFLEMDEKEGEITRAALWPKRLSAIDIRLEKKLTAQERAAYTTDLPYLFEFLKKTSEYDLATGKAVLPENIPAKGKVRGVAFFAELPKDIDKYSMYFSGISNRYRVKRSSKTKTAFYQRVVRFTFSETGDEFEISRDLLNMVKKDRLYRHQYMGLYKRKGEDAPKRRLEHWESERQAIEGQGMTDPVEKWEADGGP
ncbi:hypothetical protein ACFL4W_00855 [Planctomycetota bacterium]